MWRCDDEETGSGAELEEPEDEKDDIVDADDGSVVRALRADAGTDTVFSDSRSDVLASYATAGTVGAGPYSD